MDRRAALAAIGSSIVTALAGCSALGDPEEKGFHLELINESGGEVTFSVLIERADEVVLWKSFAVEDQTASASVGQLIPSLGIEEPLAGPIEIRLQAAGRYTEVTLESDRIEWTPGRTEADFHISVWLRDGGEVVAYT